MAVMTWDSNQQAFVESEIPKTYNQQLEAWEDSTGHEYNRSLEAWEKVWPTKLWLYRDGDECVGVTGGWRAEAGSLVRNSGDMVYSSADIKRNIAGSVLPVDLRAYSALYAHYKSITYSANSDTIAVVFMGVGSTGGTDTVTDIAAATIFSNQGEACLPASGQYSDVTICCGVENVESGYIKPVACNTISAHAKRSITAIIDRIWLE